MSENDIWTKMIFDKKTHINYACIMPNCILLHSVMHGRDTTLYIQHRIIITETHVKFQPD